MDAKKECLDRISILKEQGLITDLDVSKLFKDEGIVCISEANILMGNVIGIVIPSTQKKMYQIALAKMKKDHPKAIPYFGMAQNTSLGMLVSFLYIGSDSKGWNDERNDLKNKQCYAYVYNVDGEYGEIGSIAYDFFMGGPIRIR